MGMKGYKVFNPDWTCRGFQYEVGQEYKLEGELIICRNGFHFCEKAADCYNYYDFDPDNKIAEVEALGEVVKSDNKSATNHIKIVRELTWHEMLEIANEGKGNSGLRNTGNKNTGHGNTGHRNTGDWNTGNFNTGDSNTGNFNTGNFNTGYWNTGNFNTGDSNTGDWNVCDRSAGFFCTKAPSPMFFNRPTSLSWSEATAIMSTINDLLNDFVKCSDNEYVEHNQALWDGMPEPHRSTILNLPNFDAEIFKEITGVDVRGGNDDDEQQDEL